MENVTREPAHYRLILDLIESQRSRERSFRRTVLNMPEGEMLDEGIEPEEIDAALAAEDPWTATRTLLKSKSGRVERNVDIDRQLEPLRGLRSNPNLLKRELAKIMWSWKLSFDGLTTGIKTSKGRKGIGYSR